MAHPVERALNSIMGFQLTPLSTSRVVASPEVKYSFDDLPLRKLKDFPTSTTSFTHVFEVVDDVVTDMPESLLKEVGQGTRSSPDFKIPAMSYVGGRSVDQFLVPMSDGKYRLIKHYHFNIRIYTSKFTTTARGVAYGLIGGKIASKRLVPQVLHHMLLHLGGWALTCKSLHAPEVEKKLLSGPEIDAGFDYIQEQAPMSTSNNELARPPGG